MTTTSKARSAKLDIPVGDQSSILLENSGIRKNTDLRCVHLWGKTAETKLPPGHVSRPALQACGFSSLEMLSLAMEAGPACSKLVRAKGKEWDNKSHLCTTKP